MNHQVLCSALIAISTFSHCELSHQPRDRTRVEPLSCDARDDVTWIQSPAGEPTKAATPGKVPQGLSSLDVTASATGWARRIQDPKTKLVFRLIEPGVFVMGLPAARSWGSGESPQHRVTISKAFYLSETEVPIRAWRLFAEQTKYKSQAEQYSGSYDACWSKPDGGDFLDSNLFSAERSLKPGFRSFYRWNDSHPVGWIAHSDAQAFCRSFGYRLPTEAEWEYACSAGTSGPYWWGKASDAGGKANVTDHSWERLMKEPKRPQFKIDDGFPITSPIGSFAANPWGLYDMLGNTWEWCADAYDDAFYGHGNVVDPLQSKGSEGVLRGGSFMTTASAATATYRNHSPMDNARADYGFRPALSVD